MRGVRLLFAGLVVGGTGGACQLLFPTVVEQKADADISVYNALGGPYWQSYSLGFNAPKDRGGAFDGRYVYLSPNGGPVERYDTHGGFGSLTSWSMGPGKAGSGNFSGAAFDGQHVYFVGFRSEGSTNDAVFASFDTKGSFADVSAWKRFNLTAAQPTATSFSGAAFDGHYVYFAPYLNSRAERFDTTLAIDDPGAWLGFDVDAVDPGAVAFEGAIYDGHYVYFVPHIQYSASDAGPLQVPSSVLARYDTKGAFGSGTAWEAAHLSALNVSAAGFAGGAFDGRYVYLAPNSSVVGLIARYDTMGNGLRTPSSWSFFQGTSVNPKAATFLCAAFDGRYIYFVPGQGSVLLRYDSLGKGFLDRLSWETYDLAQVGSNAYGFFGAVFDGQYVYFVPGSTSFATQFEARASPLLPKLPGFSGSFF